MARTVDPEKHEARRLVIIDAGLTCFGELGYDGATTAKICRQAGIGSGTFFHYFPTKAALLLAILEYGTQETRDWFAAQVGRADAAQVVRDWVRHLADDVTDPRLPGFVRAVGAVMTESDVAAALAADDDAQRAGLRLWVRRAQKAGEIRTDLTAPGPDQLGDARPRRLPRSPRHRARLHRHRPDPHPPRHRRPPPGALTSRRKARAGREGAGREGGRSGAAA